MSKDSRLLICPDTKVAALLDAYPELEAVLVELAPAFKNLRNPVLRRTVAKVATLDRAAKIAGLPAREVVDKLRAAVGQPVDGLEVGPVPGECSCTPAGCHTSTSVEHKSCDWLDEARIVETIDADALLAAGTSPLGKVLAAAKSLPADAILSVTVAFRPVPLIETLEQQGFQTFCRQHAGDSFELFVSPSAVTSTL